MSRLSSNLPVQMQDELTRVRFRNAFKALHDPRGHRVGGPFAEALIAHRES
jgi:hypothetical protein